MKRFCYFTFLLVFSNSFVQADSHSSLLARTSERITMELACSDLDIKKERVIEEKKTTQRLVEQGRTLLSKLETSLNRYQRHLEHTIHLGKLLGPESREVASDANRLELEDDYQTLQKALIAEKARANRSEKKYQSFAAILSEALNREKKLSTDYLNLKVQCHQFYSSH